MWRWSIKRLEGEVLDMLHHTFQQTSRLEGEGLTVDPHQFWGWSLTRAPPPWPSWCCGLAICNGTGTYGHAQPPQPVL